VLTRRILETLAMLIIGDSILCIVSPRRHASLWLEGPQWWHRAWRPFIEHSAITRILGAFGLGLGIWLAWKQEVSVDERRTEKATHRVLSPI